jgi:hypothetical protein
LERNLADGSTQANPNVLVILTKSSQTYLKF